MPLRRSIAGYLGAARGVCCRPHNVVIVSGVQHALDLVTRVLVRPGDAVVVEDPLYPGARCLFESADARLIPVSVDDEGIEAGLLNQIRRAEVARLAYVTPVNQSPTGIAMSLRRRLALIEWASRTGAYIFEDDYDGEYRYDGRPLPALQGLDNSELVIYAGTFSKVLFPTIRLGYLVLPDRLVDPVLRLRSLSDRFTAPVDQAVLASFIEDGHFARHVRRMRAIYAARHDLLVSEGERRLLSWMRVQPTFTGLETLAWLESDCDDSALSQYLSDNGIECLALSAFQASNRKHPPALLLGFSGFTEEQLRDGVSRLSALMPDAPKRKR